MINVDLLCSPLGHTGYDYHGKALAKALATKVNIAIPPAPSSTNVMDADEFKFFADKFKGPTSPKPDAILQFLLPTFWRPIPGVPNIGIFSWETNRISTRDVVMPNGGDPATFNWMKQCNKMDEIWTFSKLAFDAIKNSGVIKPIRIINGPFDFDHWTKPFKKTPIVNVTNTTSGLDIPRSEKKFTVLAIGEWVERKNLESLIKCVCVGLPFQKTTLVLKTHVDGFKQDYIPAEIQKIKQALKLPNTVQIVLIDDLINEDTMRTLISECDVYLTTSKGEGLDIPLMQAMSMGKICVAGYNGAHVDYLTKENSFPINCTPEIVMMKEDPFYKHHIHYHSDQIWAKPNEVDVVMALQTIYQEWEKDKDLTKYNGLKANARETIKKQFSLQSCGEKCYNYLRNITGKS